MNEHNFAWALGNLMAGYALTRFGWNAPNQSVHRQVPDENSKMSVPYLYLHNAQGLNVPWVPSQGDLFATDWEIVK